MNPAVTLRVGTHRLPGQVVEFMQMLLYWQRWPVNREGHWHSYVPMVLTQMAPELHGSVGDGE